MKVYDFNVEMVDLGNKYVRLSDLYEMHQRILSLESTLDVEGFRHYVKDSIAEQWENRGENSRKDYLVLKYLLSNIIKSLPENRSEWLDPAIERIAREALGE